MRVLPVIAVLLLAACSAEVTPRPEPIPRSEAADIDGDGNTDNVDLVLDKEGWRLALTFGGRPHDTRTIDRGWLSAQAPWALYIRHGGAYDAAPIPGAERLPIRPTEDVIIYDRHDGRRILVWNSPDVGIERIAIR